MKDIPIAPRVVDEWTGFFIGAGIGGGVMNYSGGASGVFDVDTTSPGTTDLFSAPLDSDEGMIFGTAQIGYDQRLPSRFLVGIFADYDFSSDTQTSFSSVTPLTTSGAPGDLLTVAGTAEVDNTFTLGGRLGYLVTPASLVYGLVGWTHSDLDVRGSYSTNVGGGTPVAFSAEESLDAVTVGGGFETLLQPGFSLKFEYRYTDLGGLSVGSDLTGAAGAGSGGSAAAEADTDLHTARVVLTWRPGM